MKLTTKVLRRKKKFGEDKRWKMKHFSSLYHISHFQKLQKIISKVKNVPDKQKLKNFVLTKSTQETLKGVL